MPATRRSQFSGKRSCESRVPVKCVDVNIGDSHDPQGEGGLARHGSRRQRRPLHRFRCTRPDPLFFQNSLREREGHQHRGAYRRRTRRLFHYGTRLSAAGRRLHPHGTQHRGCRHSGPGRSGLSHHPLGFVAARQRAEPGPSDVRPNGWGSREELPGLQGPERRNNTRRQAGVNCSSTARHIAKGDATMPSITNKIALVTGASRGMGRATALALAAAGARVLVHYGRNADEAKSVVDQIRAAGGRADALAADLSAPDGAHALAAQVRNLIGNRLTIIRANAGISKAAAIEEMTVKDFDNLFAVNVRAPYFPVQQLLPILGNGSSIVFLSSLGAHAAVGALSAYAATKGAIDTDMSSFTKSEDGRATVQGMQALKRIGQPDDVASVIVFLASEDARWITGDTIHVDGGSKL